MEFLIVRFIRDADLAAASRATGSIGIDRQGVPRRNALVDFHSPEDLVKKLQFSIPEHGTGRNGFLDVVQDILRYSVNTWDQGFMDKLYSALNPVSTHLDPFYINIEEVY